MRDNFENSPDGVAGFERGIDFGFHFFLRSGIHAAQWGIQIGADRLDFFPGRGTFQTDVTHLHGVAGDLCAELAQQQFCKGPGCDTGCGFASRGALQNVARIMKIEFLGAREIGVARSRRKKFSLVTRGFSRCFDGQNVLPVRPIAVFNAQGDGRADGLAVAHARENIGAILFDFLPAAASVAELAAVKFVIDEVQIDREGRWEAGNKRKQRLSVRFTGGVELQHLRERPH